MEYSGAAASRSVDGAGAGRSAGWMAPLVTVLFFAWGFATVLIDTLIPKLKGLFALSYAEVMLTQFCFFLAYLVMSTPASMLINRIGYIRGLVAGLCIMAVGCLLFSPAAALGVYPGFLAALFVMASGITILQVAANPLMATLGDPAKSHSRLTFAQFFNSLGTFVGPWVGSALILAGGVAVAPDPKTISAEALAVFRRTEAHAVQLPFLGIAAGLIVLAVIFWIARRSAAAPAPAEQSRPAFTLLRRPRLALGVLSIFLYVGAEVSIGSLMINYLMQKGVLGLDAVSAGHLVSFYWGGAMVGRLIGSAALRFVKPGAVLCACAVGAALMAAVSANTAGVVAAATLIGVGLFNSIMFPTIFALAIEGLGEETPQGSGLLCMAIVGGAVVPLITGALADHFGLALALTAPILCYGWICAYGLLTRSGVLDRRYPLDAATPGG
ncbi:glucose/galactose MFS transporter [Caulobacter sp. CCUG 60055]|uniref:sugar MFS transporter n=1 Tax=Caulobacter sp. CCUG 60055 TaxID=2100090 RepID=UPI001FA72AB8|nr:sugar MFS transporter [Caulobacter sp. CCUG 60055]MBQ1541986.1 sugar MFS transporter [Caulobacteraceae bacterium]MCI3180300.1 glucose/galactose MFS transporter [Caulobacter sp. CCUG 60055]